MSTGHAAHHPSRVGIFDAHCDTAMKVLDGATGFIAGDGPLHVTLPAMETAAVGVQVFACCVVSERHPGREKDRAERMIATIEAMADAANGRMRIARTAADLREAFIDGPIAAVIGLEGADPLEGRAEQLRRFVDLGVRNVIFAWQDNPFSGTAFGMNTPLTHEGERLLGLAEELKVMVDVSHLSDAAFEDVCGAAVRPFIASHSNCRALCPHRRNLTDEMIRSLADRGGVMGINLAPAFLDPEIHRRQTPLFETSRLPGTSEAEKDRLRSEATSLPRPSIDWVVRHVQHAIDVGGEGCVGLGGDLDGIEQTPEGIGGIADYVELVRRLRAARFTDRQLAKLCHGNFLRVFEDVLP